MLFVDEQERAPEVEAFAARYGLESVFAMDFTGEVGAQYQLISTPTTYFVDPNGVIQNIHAGVITLDWIDSLTQRNAQYSAYREEENDQEPDEGSEA